MRIIIRRRSTKRHGIAFDLDYRWKGRRYKPLLGYSLTEEQAQQRAIDIIGRIQRGEIRKAQQQLGVTLHDIVPLYWKSFQVKNRVDRVRPAGIIERFLLPYFGDRPLVNLCTEDALNYVVKRQNDEAAAGTIRREFQVLNRLLNLAVRYDKLDKNRLKEVELPEATKRQRVADPAELERIRAVKSDAVAELWRIVLVAANTGLREGKVLSIKRTWIRKEQDGATGGEHTAQGQSDRDPAQ